MSNTQDYLNELKRGCGKEFTDKMLPDFCGKNNDLCIECFARIEACEKLIKAIELDYEHEVRWAENYDYIDGITLNKILRGGA